MKYSLRTFYKIIIISVLIYLIYLYIAFQLGYRSDLQISRQFCLYFTSAVSLLYLYLYRKDNLCCFEFIFFILYLLSFYFQEIVIGNVNHDVMITGVLENVFNQNVLIQTLLAQVIGFLFFVLGAIYGNERTNTLNRKKTRNVRNKGINLYDSVNILGVITGVYVIYLFFTGVISSWFQYSDFSNSYSNLEIVFLTTLMMPMTIMEFTRLSKCNCNNMLTFLLRVNKLYLVELLTIFLLLLFSGNRNEALLIIAPTICAYSLFVNRISNKKFLMGVLIGVLVMVVIGLTRQIGVSVNNIANTEMDLYSSTRDFVYVDINTAYLIDYTNHNGFIYFKNSFLNAVSMIPFLGTIIKTILGIDYDNRSAQIATEGLQDPLSNSGLGTSIIGDLYYTAGIPFVILYMFFFGWLMAYLYNYFFVYKKNNVWLLSIFLFNFGNSVYFIRAEWMMPFRYIGFTCIIMYLCFTLIPAKRGLRKTIMKV